MTKELCKDCGKPSISNSPGSVTSYFFQYNSCQCKKNEQRNKPDQNKPSHSGRNSPVCANCGKSRPTDRRAGSFTSFLFKELRCNCAGAATPKSAASAVSTPNTARTSTGDRVAQRRQFTESVRNRRLTASNSKSQKNLSAGDIVGNTFRISSVVGMGGMGVVYLAEHTALHRQVALKVLATELVNEQNWLRFQAEAKTLASLNHPTFVKVYDLGIDVRAMPFYSMDYLQGYSLEERLMINGPLSLEEAISVFLEVLDGLAYAHRNGIVHRDIKPGNIMICTVDGVKTVKVLDFGISKLVGADALKSQSLTAVGELFGSPFYMSPEQCMGNAVDARSDVYSIGCTLFEVLTGFVPFEAHTALEIMTMHQEQEPPLLSDVLPDSQFPPSVDLVLKKCLAKLPPDRYQSAKELAIDLQRIKEGKDVRDYSMAFPEKIQVKEHHANQVARKQKKNRLIGEGSSFHRNILISGFLGVFVIAVLASASWFAVHKNVDIQNHRAASISTVSSFLETNHSKRIIVSDDAKKQTWSNRPFGHSIKLANGQKVTVFEFPKEFSAGEIRSLEAQHRLEARGEVTIPFGELIGFRPSREFLEKPELFRKFGANEIAEIDVCDRHMFNDNHVANMRHLVSIRCLNLKDTNLSNKCIDDLNCLTQLRELNVTNTDIDDQALARLNRLKNLEFLEAREFSTLATTVKALAGSKKLRMLSISNTCTDNNLLKDVAKNHNLTSLILSQNRKITAEGVKCLLPLTQLDHLNLMNCQVGPESIATLASFKKMRLLKLSISNWSKTDLATLRQFLPENCKLEVDENVPRKRREVLEQINQLRSTEPVVGK